VSGRRILIVSPGDGRSGAGQFRHSLACALSLAGYAVTIAQPDETGPLQDKEAALGVVHHPFRRDPYQDHAAFGFDKALATDELRRSDPELVIFSSGVSPIAQYSFMEATAAGGIPYVIVEHQVSAGLFRFRPAISARFPELYRRANMVVAVSEENLSTLRQSLALPDRVGRVILYGRPDIFFQPRDEAARAALRHEWGVPDDALVALTVAKFEPVKGHRFLLAALHRLKTEGGLDRLYAVWIGDGAARPRLEQAVAELDLGDRVRLLGFRFDVASLYDGGDVMVMPSLSEGMPLTVMEAMAKGLPPICTDVGGTAEAIADTGIVLPPPTGDGRTVAGMVAGLRELSGDRARLARLSERARRRAGALFREDRMIEEYLDLVSRALSGRALSDRTASEPAVAAPDGALPVGDYAAPGLPRIRLDDSFPNMVVGDKASATWPYLRVQVPHNWYVDRRRPTVGFLNRDEAHILYGTALRFRGQRALEIGCWLGWSAAHLAAAGVELDVVDPLLADPEIHGSVLASLRHARLAARVRLLPGASPGRVLDLAGVERRRWSLIFVDGNHDRPHPLLDAKTAALVAEDDALIMFHDLVSPEVAEGLDFLRANGWNTMIYQTMQIMGAAWRGRVEPAAHIPDPSVEWPIPDHLHGYRVAGADT
jgi:glycosyltransferase involved in cell wall biosynthesis/predicted O-methyltransferase YrrM